MRLKEEEGAEAAVVWKYECCEEKVEHMPVVAAEPRVVRKQLRGPDVEDIAAVASGVEDRTVVW